MKRIVTDPSAFGVRARDGAGAVDVALDEMAAEPIGEPHRPFEVHRIAGAEVAEARARERLGDGVGGPTRRRALDDGRGNTR